MKQDVLSINLLFPVLNERLRLENGIERSMAYLKENVTIPYQLTILDNCLLYTSPSPRDTR